MGRLLGTSLGPPVPERSRLDWRAGTPAPEPTERAPACPEDGSAATAAGCRPIADAGVTDAGDGGAPARTADGRVVLNAATARELRELPGIGEKRAEQILALRDRLGRFRRVEELLQVRGLGPRTLARLKPLVVVDPPR